MHKAAAVNSQPLDRPVAAGALKQVAAVAAVVEALRQVLLDRPAAVEAVKQEAAVAAVVEALKLTLPQQAPETFARFFLTGAGIWACCAAIRKSI